MRHEVTACRARGRTDGAPAVARRPAPGDTRPIAYRGRQGVRSSLPALGAGAAVITAIGTLIGGLAAAGLLGGGDADPAPGPPGPTGTAGPEAGTTATAPASDAGAPVGGPRLGWEPTAAEQELGRMIPAVFRPDCGPVAPLTAPTVAAVVRRPTHGRMEYRVEYHRFESAARLNAFMAGREKLGDETSDCGKTASGSSTYTAQGETAGKLVCYLREGQAWIEWSNVGARVYASARRTDGNWRALFNFWTGAGPLVPAP